MKKKEFMDLLKYYLSELPKVVVDDIVSDYEEHFDIGKQNGKSEEEISSQLGSPQDIAQEYLSNENGKIKNYHKNKKTNAEEQPKKKTNILVVILAVIGAIMLLPFAGGIGLGVFGLIIGIIAFIIGLIVAIFAGGIGLLILALALPFSFLAVLPSFITIPVFIYALSMPTRIFLSVALFFISILAIMAGIALIKLIFKLIKDAFISIKWKINKRRNQ